MRIFCEKWTEMVSPIINNNNNIGKTVRRVKRVFFEKMLGRPLRRYRVPWCVCGPAPGLQLCSYAAMQLCSYAVMQLCSYAAMQLCSHAAVPKFRRSHYLACIALLSTLVG